MTHFLSLALLVLTTFSVAAHEGMSNPVERLEVKGIGRLDYQHLFTETSVEGETLDAFVLRITPLLRAYSDDIGFEACGVLATDGERVGVVVGPTSPTLLVPTSTASFRPG